MLSTEEEAKKCWCPFALTHIGAAHGAGNVTLNRSSGVNAPKEGTLCLASRCMMWRFRATPLIFTERGDTARRGYCGLAGWADKDEWE